MPASILDELRSYVCFEATDEEALRALHRHARAQFTGIATLFYDRILAHPGSAQVLRSSEQIDRLRLTLVDWMDSLLAGPWDEAYLQRRLRIGHMHVRVKLPQRYMFSAMAVIRDQLHTIAEGAPVAEPQRQAMRRALDKILDIELAIMLESYGAETLEISERVQRLERNRLERRLEVTETRCHEVIENAEILIIGVDRAGRVNLFNRKAEEVSGRTREQLLGAKADKLLGNGETLAARLALEGAMAGQVSEPFEAPLAGVDERRTVRWHLVPMPAASEIGACAFGVDVTDTRRLENANRRAERLAALGTLAAGLAHEIRNPLNSANLQLTLAERRMNRLDDPRARGEAAAAIHIVQQEVRRLGGMVEDFLAFARPRPLRIAAGDLRAIGAEVVDLLTPDAARAGVALELASGELVVACFDVEQMRQLLHNLVRNAIEAAGDDGRVQVTIERTDRTARIMVVDSGPGPAEGIDIFAPFVTTKAGGTGLGLPIVHRIVTDHGGEIAFQREHEQTVVRVDLPLDGPEPRASA